MERRADVHGALWRIYIHACDAYPRRADVYGARSLGRAECDDFQVTKAMNFTLGMFFFFIDFGVDRVVCMCCRGRVVCMCCRGRGRGREREEERECERGGGVRRERERERGREGGRESERSEGVRRGRETAEAERSEGVRKERETAEAERVSVEEAWTRSVEGVRTRVHTIVRAHTISVHTIVRAEDTL
jgi:hypothetical protein